VQFRVKVTKVYYSRTHVKVPGCTESGRGTCQTRQQTPRGGATSTIDTYWWKK